ncbi:hypothetical protein [Colwellia psychrerythraea]|uniref:Uncharacterized protein n=1 Tax=Colwellia psychrerythraea TaxID=28229 RepID=A0A099KXD2_COLPS|nr:hypothetical protein [Colwellia psychrerythraea]KGJ94845.1 hypothetical protein GAB14E_2079 [Colwellia psychrerythraea]
MKNQKILIRIVTMSIVVVSVWLFWPSMSQQLQITVNEPLIKTPQIEVSKLPAAGVSKNTLSVVAEKITSNDSATLVAKAYAAELNFPRYSQPLTDKDFDRLQPNHFNPQSIPIDDEGTQVTAALSKYRYIYPEQVFATLTGEDIVSAELQLVDTNTGNVLLTSKFEQGDNNWYAQFDGERDLPRQLQATVKARINGKNITIALALKYVDSIATLEGFGSVFNRDADMVLPANLITREKGLYRIRANLFDANNQPIAHLVSKEKLNKGSSHINLKAHQSVLQGKQAPFYLSTFSIELMSPAPGKPTRYGNSEVKKYEIKDFAVSSLNDIPYQPSEQEQQRLLLLQNMAEGS